MFIPDPNCLHPGSWILIKEFKYFNPKKSKKMISKLLKNMIRVVHPGSRIRMLAFSHPGSRIQGSKSTQSRIRIRNTGQKDPDPYLFLMDPDMDPGGPKTRGSGGSGSGSATLLKRLKRAICGVDGYGIGTYEAKMIDFLAFNLNNCSRSVHGDLCCKGL